MISGSLKDNFFLGRSALSALGLWSAPGRPFSIPRHARTHAARTLRTASAVGLASPLLPAHRDSLPHSHGRDIYLQTVRSPRVSWEYYWLMAWLLHCNICGLAYCVHIYTYYKFATRFTITKGFYINILHCKKPFKAKIFNNGYWTPSL